MSDQTRGPLGVWKPQPKPPERNPDAQRDTLLQLVAWRDRARADEAQAQAMIRETVPLAKRAGVPMAEIARILGVSRQTAYDLLN